MRILQIINSLILAGAEILVSDLVSRFRALSVDVDVAVLKFLDSPLEKRVLASGAHLLRTTDLSFYSPRHAIELSRLIGAYDLVHAHLFPSQLWCPLATILARSRTPAITTEHNTENRRRRSWLRPIDRWMYRQYRLVACISEPTAKRLVEWIPEVADKIRVIPNGIPLERFSRAIPVAKKDVVSGDVPVVMFVARFEPQKDHETLLRAIAQLKDPHVVFVGDGPLGPRLRQLANKLGIANRVHFLGRRQDVPELLKMADIYVQSSHFEGFGIAALEAMAAGVPVIAADVPGLADLVRGAGLLFPPGNEKLLAAALHQLLESPGLRGEIACAGLKRAEEYSIDHVVSAYLELYQLVLMSKTAPVKPA